MSRGLRITIVVSLAGFGGAQIAALRLARGLRDRGHDPRVLFLYELSPIPDPDHPYEVMIKKPRPGTWDYLRMAGGLFRRLRRERPEIVLSFLPLANAGLVTAWLAGVRKRVVSHRTPVNTTTAVLRHLDTLWAKLGIYTGVVAVSEGVRASCHHYPERLLKHTVVVHNGIHDWRPSALTRSEARQRLGVADGKLLLMAVGRLAEQKNYPFMLRVVQRLDNAMLLVAGDGPLRPELEAMISKLRIGDRVRLLGAVQRPDIPDLLAAADVFIQTSTFEGHSNSVLEALLTNLPVVAHDIPEQRETIAEPDGSAAGALLPLEDLDAWVAAIERLRDDPRLAQTAREIAGRRAAVFRYDSMIAGFERALTNDG